MARSSFSRRDVLQTTAAIAAVSALPARAAPGEFNFLAVGDWGRNSRSQRDVASQMATWAEKNLAQFVLTVGDNFYPKGVTSVTDTKWKSHFEDIYSDPALGVPWYVSLGNHDHDGDPQAQLDYVSPSGRWRISDRSYVERITTPDGKTIDLFAIDTAPLAEPYEYPEAAQGNADRHTTFTAALRDSKADWKLVFGHHPVYSGGHHGNTDVLIAWLKPVLEAHGAQAYICGHDHDLQHLVSGPVNYVCTGAGSSTRAVSALPGLTKFHRKASGFTGYRLVGDVLTVEFIDTKGKVLHAAPIPRIPI